MTVPEVYLKEAKRLVEKHKYPVIFAIETTLNYFSIPRGEYRNNLFRELKHSLVPKSPKKKKGIRKKPRVENRTNVPATKRDDRFVITLQMRREALLRQLDDERWGIND